MPTRERSKRFGPALLAELGTAARAERAQVLMITALLLPILLAMVGMAIDIGTYSSHRRSLQNAADGAALAGGQELPDTAAAEATALEYAVEHGVDANDVTVTFSGGSTAPRIRVSIDETHEFSFMQIVGFDNRGVGAAAAAERFSFGAGEGVVPWSIEEPWLETITSGDEVIIKYDSGGPSPGNGNFGAVRIDGSGGSDYEESAKYGASHAVCSVMSTNCTTAGCPGTYPGSCAENSDQCDGPECRPKTGNMTGPTRDAVDFRVGYTSGNCDTFEEAFNPPASGSDVYSMEAECHPWSGGRCATRTSICSRRIFLVPVVDQFNNGSSDDVEIQEFALVFLEGYQGTCKGNSCDIRARFVKAQFTAGFMPGAYDPDANLQYVKLVE